MHKDYEDTSRSTGEPEYFRIKTVIGTSALSPFFDLGFSFVTDDDEGELEVGQEQLIHRKHPYQITSESILSDVISIFKKLDDFFKTASMSDVYGKYDSAENWGDFSCLKYALIGEG